MNKATASDPGSEARRPIPVPAPAQARDDERVRSGPVRSPAARTGWGRWLTWTVGFLAFPIAGVLGRGLVGRVDDPVAAVVGGALAGAVIGTGQWLASRREIAAPAAWIAASTGGMAVGLLAGAAAVDYATDLGDLALMGLITGVPLGAAQAVVMRPRWPRAWSWALAMPALWALGWIVTTSIGVDVERQYVVFGSVGAITVMGLSGLLLEWLRGAGRGTVR
jgi:hypothetical protein